MTVQVGVVGAGWWATYAHLPAIVEHSGARLRSVQKRDRAAAERVARDFAAVHAYDRVEDLLADPDLDAVVIASTPNAHYGQARAALERGLHVLLEKPMTLTVDEARALVRLAERQGCHLLISCPWHYTAHARIARDLIATGALGKLTLISILMTNSIGALLRGDSTAPTYDAAQAYTRPGRDSYSDPAIAGGGQIYCQIAHVAAHLALITGQRAREVFATFARDGAAVDLHDTLQLRLEDGALVSVASTGTAPESQRHYEIRVFGSQGLVQMDLWRGTLSQVGLDERRIDYPDLPASEIYPARAPARNLIDVIRGEAENLSPGTLGLAAMEIIDAACRSNASRQLTAIAQ